NGCPGTNIIVRTWTATDACGNSASCVQTITIQDTTPPNLTCQPDRTVPSGVAWSFDEPVATDTCSTVTVQVLNTVTNLTGTNVLVTRTWLAADACGNTNTCQQTITQSAISIQSTQPPAILTQPQGQTAAYGGSTTLSTTLSGTGPFTYQWQFDGT